MVAKDTSTVSAQIAAAPAPRMFVVDADRWLGLLTLHVSTRAPADLTVEGLPAEVQERLHHVQGLLDIACWLLRIVAWRAGDPDAELPRVARHDVILALCGHQVRPLGEVLQEWSTACRERVRWKTH